MPKYRYADPIMVQQGHLKMPRSPQYAVPVPVRGRGGIRGWLGKVMRPLVERRAARQGQRQRRRPLAEGPTHNPFQPAEPQDVVATAQTARIAAAIMDADKRKLHQRDLVAKRQMLAEAQAAKRGINGAALGRLLKTRPMQKPIGGKVMQDQQRANDARREAKRRQKQALQALRASKRAERRLRQEVKKKQREAKRAERRSR